VLARVSESGNANRQDGDLESKPLRVSLPAHSSADQPIRLVLGAK
jgi:cytochrome c-type biogenesis protein CcmH